MQHRQAEGRQHPRDHARLGQQQPDEGRQDHRARESRRDRHAPTAKKPRPLARRQAAVILEQEDQDFRDFLAQGEKAVGTPQWPAWNQKAIVGLDMKQTAFSKADAQFTADNEPTDLLEQWREDDGEAD